MSEAEILNEATADARHPAVIESHSRLDRMRDEIVRLELERNIVELELYGYTVLQDVSRSRSLMSCVRLF